MIDVFSERAQQLATVRELVREDASYASATALLSVHTAIALSDALLLQLTGGRGKEQDHRLVAVRLKKACKAKTIETSGIRQLELLLSIKTDVSYSNRRVTQDRAATLAVASQRFERWAYRALEATK